MSEPEERPRAIRVELTIKTALITILAIACVWLFLQLWMILLVIVIALMIVGMLDPFVGRLERRGVRRGYAIAIVFASLFLLVVAVGALTLPSLVTEVSDMVQRMPQMQAQVADRLEAWKFGGALAKSIRDTHPDELIASVERAGISYTAKVIEFAAYAASSFFLALYFMIDRDRMRGAVFALVPREYHVRLSRVLLNLETIVGGYMRGQIITSAMMAVFTFVVLLVARVPNAVALSAFAGVADVLPYIGALLACGPAFIAALPRGLTIALGVLGVLALYQEFESRVIIPRVYGKVLRLPAATVMVSLLIGAKLLGILGALLALPVAAGIRMIIMELRLELPGDDSDDPEAREKDEAAEQKFEQLAEGAPPVEAAAIATEIAEERREQDAANPEEAAVKPIAGKPKK